MTIRDKGEIPVIDHHSGEMTHDGGGLYVQVPQHFITAPTPNKFDAVVVDAGTKKCHSTGRAQGASGDIFRQETYGVAKDADRRFKDTGDVGGTDEVPFVVVEVVREGCCGRSAVAS